jgi:hypothetical protein
MVEVYNFLQDNGSEIVRRTEALFTRDGDAPPRGPAFTALVTRLFDGYVDYYGTGEPEVLDRLFRVLFRALAIHKLRFSDVFTIPLTMSSVIRDLLFEKQQGPDPWPPETFREAIDSVEREAHGAAARFLDLLQDRFYTAVTDHNAYLQTLGERLKTQIESLPMERPAYYRSNAERTRRKPRFMDR